MPCSKRAGLILGCAVCLAGLYLAAPYGLSALGHVLVFSEPAARADIALVLAGDYSGNRVLRGAELVDQGYAPFALVDGPTELYGQNEADLAIDLAVSRGRPRAMFQPFRFQANSTAAEARYCKEELKRRGVRSVLLVTSTYHTARARRTFRRIIPEVQFHTVSAPDIHFDPDSWWKSREGRKTAFFELSKTVADWFGI